MLPEHIRIATPEEIEEIRAHSDITPNTAVWAFDKIRAVIRNGVTEVDPVFFNDATNQKKVIFMWGMENMLRVMGIQEYYCNVPVSEEYAEYRKILEALKFEPTSKEPEMRFKKVLQ